MAVTVTDFRSAFPEFDDAVVYPDAQVQFWLSFESSMFNEGRWGDLLSKGVMLFAAHNLSLQRRNIDAAEFGGVPGSSVGVLTSKSVDKVSAGYDTSSVSEENAGQFNATTYGKQYIHLARLIGAGPVHVGLPSLNELILGGSAWAGPNLG